MVNAVARLRSNLTLLGATDVREQGSIAGARRGVGMLGMRRDLYLKICIPSLELT
jgi:hypothetical protein